MNVQIEVNDGIRNVPETIQFVRINGQLRRTVQMLDQQNYKYAIGVSLSRGQNSYTVTVQMSREILEQRN